MFKDRTIGQKLVCLVLLAVLAALSIGYVSPYVSEPANRADAISTLDDQKLTAMGLTATVTSTSFLVSALPDDTGTSIADELDDLSSILMLIVCVIYLEKFLLTTTGLVSFSVLIPIACALLGISLFHPGKALRVWGVKILLFAVLLFLMVPTGVTLTNMVQDTFRETIDQSMAAVEQLSSEVGAAEAEDTSAFKQFINGITDGIQRLFETAKNMLSALTDAIAVLVITTCAIPLLTLLFFLWVIKLLFGYQIRLPHPPRLPRHGPRPHLPEEA